MTNFHFSVDVNIGLTAALQSFLESFRVNNVNNVVAEQPKEQKAAAKKPAKAVTPEQQFEEVKKENPAVADLEKKLDLKVASPAEHIRTAMADCRTRIEGEGYTKDSAYHKELTAEFRRIAQLLGSEKPSELPSDKVESFIEAINNLYIDENMTLNTKLPF